ncbi:cytospin-A [Hoplias malabaricus]|uniref:cytospin-A n=1 Tax=Hoplias malabaricus TaxID=27720 RepID=UPI003461C0AC
MGNYSVKERHGSPGSPSDPFQTPRSSTLTFILPQSPTHSDSTFTSHGTSRSVIGSGSSPSESDHLKAPLSPRKANSLPLIPRRQRSVEDSSARDTVAPPSPAPPTATPPTVAPPTSSPTTVAPPTSPTTTVVPPTAALSTSSSVYDGVIEQGILQECVLALGISSLDERTHTLTDLLKGFLTEREQMKEELKSLKEKIEAERSEWLQFQSDLQVALVVADRLRMEAEEEVSVLREAQLDWERQIAEAQQGRREVEGQVEHLKAELQQNRQRLGTGKDTPGQQGVPPQLGGKGPVECCVKSVGAGERWKEERGRGETEKAEKQKDSTERSRSLSRLPSDPPSSTVNGISQMSIALTTRSVNKNNNPARERLTLDQQDNLINSFKDKKDENLSHLSSSPLIDLPTNKASRTKPQEDFSKLVRRHGGSKRNSLLRWCQNRTIGYTNIEITNFSSSWIDGLAFCAVYHTYLPSHIPYKSLSPENKKENLLMAFQTGESIGIPASLTVEEMLKAEGPDWQRVLGYVESIYRHFEM